MPSTIPPHHPKEPPNQTPKRAVVVIADGTDIRTDLDRARRDVDRRPDLNAVAALPDDPTGNRFRDAVEQVKRGDVDVVVLPDPSHLPPWIVFLRGAPRQRRT